MTPQTWRELRIMAVWIGQRTRGRPAERLFWVRVYLDLRGYCLGRKTA